MAQQRREPEPIADLSPKQAAPYFGVTAKTIRRWCRAGLIGYRVSGEYRISWDELRRVRRVDVDDSPKGAA